MNEEQTLGATGLHGTHSPAPRHLAPLSNGTALHPRLRYGAAPWEHLPSAPRLLNAASWC